MLLPHDTEPFFFGFTSQQPQFFLGIRATSKISIVSECSRKPFYAFYALARDTTDCVHFLLLQKYTEKYTGEGTHFWILLLNVFVQMRRIGSYCRSYPIGEHLQSIQSTRTSVRISVILMLRVATVQIIYCKVNS